MDVTRAATALQDGVLDRLGREIVGGGVEAGHRYTLEGLQAGYGISRTVARDVVRVLDSLGLVTPRRSVGVVVNPASDWNVYAPRVIQWRLAGPGAAAQFAELTQLRIAVEPLAAAAAAEHASVRARAELTGLAAELRRLGEAGEQEAFLVADRAFHALVLRESGNAMFAALRDVVGEVLTGRTHAGMMPFHPREEALAGHEALAAAITAGDAAAAERAARGIVVEVRSALESGSPAAE